MSLHHRFAPLTVLAGLCLAPAAAQARITFDFDYSLSSGTGLFAAGSAARTMMEQAATVYSDRLLDTLPAIAPTATDEWYAQPFHPTTGALVTTELRNIAIPANTIKIYVGGRNLGGALGVGGPGGWDFQRGSTTLLNAIWNRGQPGATTTPPTDFGSWGGSISFDTAVNWNLSTALPAGQQNDFLSVAVHEMAHVLGIGLSGSWQNLAKTGVFTGPKSVAVHGGNVPLEGALKHFNYGVSSTVGGVAQETLMDPDIVTGTREYMTLLDWAALDDIGWDLARPGDADANGLVNFDDLLILASNYSRPSQRRWSAGDFDYNGTVNFDDLLLLASNYNRAASDPVGAPASASGAFGADWNTAQALAAGVPEPTAIALTVVVAIPALTSRRRRIQI